MQEGEKLPSYKHGRIAITPGQPFELTPVTQQVKLSKSDREKAEHVGNLLSAYIKHGHELIRDKYKHVSELAPLHLREPNRCLALCCTDGVIVRYEPSQDGQGSMIIGVASESMFEIITPFSENIIYCIRPEGPGSIDISNAPTVVMGSQAPGGPLQSFTQFHLAVLVRVDEMPKVNSGRPFRLVGLANQFEIRIVGRQVPVDNLDAEGQPFLARSTVRIPGAWNYVEMFPAVELTHWNSDFGYAWAESDILEAVMKAQIHDQELRSLDPNVDIRKQKAALLSDYKSLLDSEPLEERLQEFLSGNPELLVPTYQEYWSKVQFGDKHGKSSDFVFRDADGQYILVEIEKAEKRLFIANGDTSAELKHAQNQILDWRTFIGNQLTFVREVLGLKDIHSNPKSTVVIGRAKSLTSQNRQKLAAIHSDSPRQTIWTYDDVYENAKAAIENIVGPLWASSGTAEVYFLPKDSPLLQVTPSAKA